MEIRKVVLMVVANTFATDTRVRREAGALARRGFQVKVLCWDRAGLRSPVETVDQCDIRNMKFWGGSILANSRFNYVLVAIMFQAAVFLWVLGQVRETRFVILHAHEFNTLPGASIAKFFFNSNLILIYDCHEFSPGVYQEWYGSGVAKIVSKLEGRLIQFAQGIIGANETIEANLVRINRVPSIVVYSSPRLSEIPAISSDEARTKLNLEHSFIVFFSGRVRQDYDFELILEAARSIRKSGDLKNNAKFLLVGPLETMRSIMITVKNEGIADFFDFRDWVSLQDLFHYYKASNLCFAITKNVGQNTRTLIPIKLFEAMACGVPLLARDQTKQGDFVRKYDCGIVRDFPNEGLTSVLSDLERDPQLLAKLGENGKRAFDANFTWEKMEEKILNLYSQLMA